MVGAKIVQQVFVKYNKNKYFEVELKFFADHIKWTDFSKFISNYRNKIIKKTLVEGPDTYFRNRNEIVRYRTNLLDYHELTVKKRTSKKTTTVRHETDILLDKNTNPRDVEEYHLNCGYHKEFTIVKKCLIIYLTHKSKLGTMVIYDIYKIGEKSKKQRFIEIEGDKIQNLKQNKEFLKFWTNELKKINITNKNICNLSLYELFSNRKYKLRKK